MNSSNFMQGYGYPRPLVTKNNLLAKMENKYPFLSLILDLLQNYPNMFEHTSNNLLYLMNLNISYKKQHIYDLFTFAMLSNPILSKKEVDSILSSPTKDEQYFQTDNLIILFAYYLQRFNDFKFYEPSMIPIHRALETFLNNPEVYYNGKKYNLNDFRPLAYSINGSNILDFVPYFAYIATFFIYGKPYKFEDDLGSGSSTPGLLSSLNTFISEHFKRLCSQTQIVIQDYTAESVYNAFKSQFGDLQGMINKMLSFDNVINLRNAEMNKASELLDDCFKNQNCLKEEYLMNRFTEVIDSLVELIVKNSPFKMCLDKFPVFEPLNIDNNMRALNIDNLMTYTEYALSGGKSSFMIKQNNNKFDYICMDEKLSINRTIGGIIQPQKLISNINAFNQSFGNAFSSADLLLKMLKEFIKARFIEQNSSFLLTPDVSMALEEPLSVSISDFNEIVGNQLFNLFIYGLWRAEYAEMNVILSGLMKYNKKFEQDFKNLLRLTKIATDVYQNTPKCYSLSTFLISYLKEAVLDHVLNSSTNDFNNFNFTQYLFNNVILNIDDFTMLRVREVYDTCVSLAFIHTDAYCRFVNISTQDFSKYVLNSIIEIPYLHGNDDEAGFYAIGGCKLYDNMLSINPFVRGYAFITQMFGTTENLEKFYSIAKNIQDATTIRLITKSSNNDTIYDALRDFTQNYRKKIIEITDFLFIDDLSMLCFNKKSNYDWINLKNIESEFIYNYVLKYSFKQVKGLPYDEVFECVRMKPSKFGKGLKASELTKGGMKYTDDQTIPVNIQTSADSYTIPNYNYASEMKTIGLAFAYPAGYKLINFELDDEKTVFLFTNSKLNTSFNKYDLN